MTEEIRRRRRRRTDSDARSDGPGSERPRKRRTEAGRAALKKRRIITGVIAAVVLFSLWSAYTGWQVYRELRDARDQALIMRSALARGDVDGAKTALKKFQDASGSAAGRTGGLTWGTLQWTPFVGDDLRALKTMSRTLDHLGDDALPPLVESASGLTAGDFTPNAHQFPLQRVAALEEPALKSSTAFNQADEELDAIDSSSFAGPLRSNFESLRDAVGSAATALDSARRAAQLMPALLGSDGPRDYLLVFQNNAELRSTGGLGGNASVIHAEDGKVEITRQEGTGVFGEKAQPVLPISAEEKALYDDQLATYFGDANFTPDYPRASELWAAHWKLETGIDVDGVFIVDPVAMSYMLNVTGPVEVEGIELTGANVVSIVENLVFFRYPLQADQDDFFNAVAKTVFDTFADGNGDPVKLLRGLAQGVNEGRVRIHSFNPEDQAAIAGTEIAGELPSEPERNPAVGVYLNDGTAAKMSYYLNYSVTVSSLECADGVQTLVGQMEIESKTPDVTKLPQAIVGYPEQLGFIKPGQQVVIADFMSPIDGSIEELKFDGSTLRDPLIDKFGKRKVLSLGLYFDPGQSHVISWTMKTGKGQTGAVETSVTPGAQPENESSVSRSSC